MEKFAVIVAGGSGKRMQSIVPKQFLTLNDKPILYYSVNTFLNAFPDIQIIVVLPADQLNYGKQIISKYFPESTIQLTSGGDTRFHSVQNGLKLVPDDCIVFVHDAVRCLFSVSLIHRCYEAAITKGNAVPVIIPRDSLRLVTDTGYEILDRSGVRIVQTPQVFSGKQIKEAFQQPYKMEFTDEATVAEACGIVINLVEGEENNLKITYMEDMLFGEMILKSAALNA